jgi:transposase
MGRQGKYPAEVRERAVRLILDHQGEYESQWAAVTSIAAKVGCSRESLRKWIRQPERDSGKRERLTTDERTRMKELEREVRELPKANEILRKASAYFARASKRPAHRSDDTIHRQPPRGSTESSRSVESYVKRSVDLLRAEVARCRFISSAGSSTARRVLL